MYIYIYYTTKLKLDKEVGGGVLVFCVLMEASGFLFGMRVRLCNFLMVEKSIFLNRHRENTDARHRKDDEATLR